MKHKPVTQTIWTSHAKPFVVAVLAAGMLSLWPQSVHAQTVIPAESKEIDNGGSGLFKACALSEKTLPGFAVYRPKNLREASVREGKLPILVWCNGGCMDASTGYERMLVDIASKGYVILAIGDLEKELFSRKQQGTPSEMVGQAIRWICLQSKDVNSDYYQCVDTSNVAAAGHSCGGAQVFFNAGNTHLRTIAILNAGMGDMEMAGASKASFANLRVPVLFMTGGPGDIAYENAKLDYQRITHVPVAWGDMPSAGHSGTYGQLGGGDFGRMLTDWLDWWLKGKETTKKVFLQSDLEAYPGWSMQQKGFTESAMVEDLWITNGNRRIYGIVSTPTNVERKKVAIVSHGFNGTHHFGRDYFATLNALGYMVYTFDYPNGSIHSRSDNNTMGMSIINEKNDLKAIVHYFQKQPDVDKDNIVLIGESQGGLVSALAAGELGKKISKLVLIYPALGIPENWSARYPAVSDIPDTTRLWNIPLGKRFFEELRGMNVYKTITQFEGPVQIIQGTNDPIVPLSGSEEAVKRYKKAQLKTIPGAGHGFKPEERRISNEFVRDFLL